MKRMCLICGKTTTVEEVLPHIYKCKEGDHFFIEKKGLGLVIGNEDIPSISVRTEAQAGIMATKSKEPINFINFKEIKFTSNYIGNKIMELPSLSNNQKFNVLNKLKDYGLET